jgi:DNA-binding NtrC family response regulator
MNTTRILLVDDEAGLRTTLAANLELEGYEVIEAGSAEEALQKVGGLRFDLVLTDIRMPGMNGVDFFRELRRRHVDAPVVLMTGFALEDLIADGLAEGAFTVLPKPFDVQHAVDTLARAAKRPLVLVVDDTESVATTTADALRACGLRAISVLDGEAALAAVARNDVDLCVVDMVLPGMSGAEVVEKLRSRNPPVSAIAISSHDVPEMIRQVSAAGAFQFVRKPFSMPDLIRLIAKARGVARAA